MIFEWDERKRCENRRKHGYDFTDCAAIFDGSTFITPDSRFAYGEMRFRAYGLLRDRVVVIVFAETEETIRVISMRKAARHEQAQYFENIQN